MTVSLIHGAQLAASPWKNGGGITREVAVCENAWRASIADIDRDGPFSRFPGIDRVLVLLDGAQLMLGDRVIAQPLDTAHFAGEDAIDARLGSGPVRVFNVMTHRGAASARIDVWRASERRIVDADTLLLHCVQDAADVCIAGTRMRLTKLDTLRIDARGGIEIETHGDAMLCVTLCVGLHIEGQS
jgi:uncharacterized protein